jgi:hypothetical protein
MLHQPGPTVFSEPLRMRGSEGGAPSHKPLHATPERIASSSGVPDRSTHRRRDTGREAHRHSPSRMDTAGVIGIDRPPSAEAGFSRPGSVPSGSSWRFQQPGKEKGAETAPPGVRGRRVCEGPLFHGESLFQGESRGNRRRLQMTPRTGRAAKSSASVHPATGAGRRGREPRQRSVSLAKSARRPASTSSAVPTLDGGREPPAALP